MHRASDVTSARAEDPGVDPNFQPCANETLAASGTPGGACVFTASFTANYVGNFTGTRRSFDRVQQPAIRDLSGSGVAPLINLSPTFHSATQLWARPARPKPRP